MQIAMGTPGEDTITLTIAPFIDSKDSLKRKLPADGNEYVEPTKKAKRAPRTTDAQRQAVLVGSNMSSVITLRL